MSSAVAWSHHRARVNGIRLHYVRAGTGDPVVLLHGWPQTWFAWRRVIPLLAERYTVIAPDLRGFGDSSKPIDGYDKQSVAEDIRALVHGLGFERILLVAHDLGAMVGYAYAAGYPEEVRRFVFIESTVPGFGLERSMDLANGGSWHFAFNMAGDISEALVAGRERLFLDFLYHRDTVGAVNPDAIDAAALDEYVRAFSRPGALRGSFAHYRALLDDARHNRAAYASSKLLMPVLAVGAEHGYGESSARVMQGVATDVRSIVIPNSGHYVPEEQPAALAEALLAFFEGRSESRAPDQ